MNKKMEQTPQQFFFSGARHTIPLLISSAPFGFIFGALAEPSGLSPIGALLMSIFVYAGASQFIALGLLAVGSPLLVIVLTTFIVNLRHILYAASLKEAIKDLSITWRTLLAFGLTDETYAALVSRFGQSFKHPQLHWFYLGSYLAMYLNWIAWTLVGIIVGQQIKNIEQWGLDFAIVVTFIGIVMPLLQSKPFVLTALCAAGLSLATFHWPYSLGLLFSVVCSIALGFAWAKMSKSSQGKKGLE